MPQIRHFHHALALAEHRNFHRAAEAVGLTQPALTQSINAIEAEYGVQLFQRSKRDVQPTVFGSVFLSAARETLSRLSHLDREMALLANLQTGHLIIGCDTLVSEAVIGPVLVKMMKAHPKLRFSVRVGAWNDVLDRLISGDIDFYVGSPSKQSDPRFNEMVLQMPSMVMVCRTGHPLAAKEVATVQDCLDYPIAGARQPAWYHEWLKRALGAEKPVDHTFAVEADDYGVIRWIVRNTDALAGALPVFVASDVEKGLLQILNVAGLDFPLPTSIITRADRPLSVIARATIDEILTEIAGGAPTDNLVKQSAEKG